MSVARRFGGVVLAFGALLALSGCAGKTTGATKVTAISARLHATARCDSGETCTWYWESWLASQPRSTSTKTAVQGPVTGPTGNIQLSTNIASLTPGTTYRWVICGSPNNGGVYGCAGPSGTFGSTTADPPPDYATFTTAAWTIQTTPNPSGGYYSSPLAVSCTSATACMAVGGEVGGVALAERWDGTSWMVQTTPNPTGATNSVLQGVSCTSATACTAVGRHFADVNGVPRSLTSAESWDGATWTVQTTPNPPDAQASLLNSVSCTSATACMAVGQYFNTSNAPETLAEHWDGTSWTIQPTPNPTGTSPTLLGVSCTSVAACTAVGYVTTPSTLGYAPVVERWDGTTWTIHSTPIPSGSTSLQLQGVSCRSPTECTTVGNYTSSTGAVVTLAERWDGTSWTIQPTPNPPDSSAGLNAVSCATARSCTAVGAYSTPNTAGQTLAERWDGTSWTIEPTPNPTDVSESSLWAVSCRHPSACTAFGYTIAYTVQNGHQVVLQAPLAERYSR